MVKMIKLCLVVVGILASAPGIAEPTFPPLESKPLLDAAGIVPDDQEPAINAKLRDITTKSKHQVMILTVPSLKGQSISDYGYQAGRHYKIGNRDSDDGVFITLAPNDKKVRIDTGYGMGSVLTDAESKLITENVMKPLFKEGDWVGGINAGLDSLAEEIVSLTPEQLAIRQREETNQKIRDEQRWNSFLNALSYIGLGLSGIGGSIWAYFLATKKKRQEKKAQEEAERQRIYDERERETALRRKAHADRLAAMTPQEREARRQREKLEYAVSQRRHREAQARIRAREVEEAKYPPVILYNDTEVTRRQSQQSTSNDSDNDTSFSGDGGSFGGGGADSSWD